MEEPKKESGILTPSHCGNTAIKCRGNEEGGSFAMDARAGILKVGGVKTATRLFL